MEERAKGRALVAVVVLAFAMSTAGCTLVGGGVGAGGGALIAHVADGSVGGAAVAGGILGAIVGLAIDISILKSSPGAGALIPQTGRLDDGENPPTAVALERDELDPLPGLFSAPREVIESLAFPHRGAALGNRDD